MKKITLVAAGFLTLSVLAARATLISVISDGSVQGADVRLNDPSLSSGDISGLAFSPVIEDALGSNTLIPPGAPGGTEVINLPGGTYYNGMSGFFLTTFTLPAGYSAPSLSGAACVDDEGWAFLNGHTIGTGMGEYVASSLSVTDPSFFHAGVNRLVISDNNAGGGPSGAAFYANVTYTSVPDAASTGILLAIACAALAGLHRKLG